MLRGLGFVFIAAGLVALVFPSLIPFIPYSIGSTAIRAGGAIATFIGVFLWWPSWD
jgi:hypothetical protein